MSTGIKRFLPLSAPPEGQVQAPAGRLGFSVEPSPGSEAVEEAGGSVQKAVVRSGKGFAYVVGYGNAPLTGHEARLAEAAKSRVVSTLASGSDEISLLLLGKAKDIAASELSGRTVPARADYIACLVAHDTVGYGPFSMLLEDRQSIEEIEVNSPESQVNVYHARYGRCPTNLRFADERSFRHAINSLIAATDKELGDRAPIIDAQVEGARVHAQIRPYALSGAAASIRLAGGRTVSIDYLAKNGTADFAALAYVWLAMDAGLNIVVAGAPASGKTTMLSAIMSFIPHYEKAVTIEEDINELRMRLDTNNTVSLYGSRYGAKTTTRDQVLNALRMRPGRIIVGEMRGEEARELFSGANMGMPFMTTMHSNSGGTEVVKRLLIRPMCVEPRSLSMLDMVLYMRQADIRRRVLSHVYEYRWLSRAETDSGSIEVGDGDAVDIIETAKDGFLEKVSLQRSKALDAYSAKTGLSRRLALQELEKRTSFLKSKCGECESTDALISSIREYCAWVR